MNEILRPPKLIYESHVLAMAFDHTAWRKIGERDHWSCMGLEHKPCRLGANGTPASARTGFIMNAAHERELHGIPMDRDSSRGRMLCEVHHAIEEIQRGNLEGALMLLKPGIYRDEYVRKTGVRQKYLGLDEVITIMYKEQIPLKDGKASIEPRCSELGFYW